MKKVSTFFTLPLLFLNACLLNQPSPPSGNGSGSSQAVNGIVILEDRIASQPVAGFVAGFIPAQPPQNSAAPSRRMLAQALFPIPLASSFATDSTSQPQCVVKKGKVSSVPMQSMVARRSSGGSLLDAGEVSFGPVLQSNRIKAQPDAKFRYFASMRPRFPAGAYEVDIAGSKDVPSVSEILTMPEALSGLRVKGDETASIPVVQQNEPFVIQWTAPAVPSEANIMVLDILSQAEDQGVLVHCVASEDDLASSDSESWSWEIPASFTSQLLIGDKAQLQFVRANDRVGQKDSIQIEFQGLRSVYLPVKVK